MIELRRKTSLVPAPRLLYLSRADVDAAGVRMREVIDALEVAFLEHGEGRVEIPPKPAIHPRPDAFIHAMPAYIPALCSVGIKWVSGYRDNTRRGLPYLAGLLILNEEDTGLPMAVMDCARITAMRTGAAAAVAARHLARPDSAVIALLGCGTQGRSHLEALRELFPLKRVVAYDTVPEQTTRFATEVEARWELPVTRATSPREAVESADLVVTSGPIQRVPHATIKAGWLRKGAFAASVDYDSYWDRAALREVSKFCVDDLVQLGQNQARGYLQDIPPVHATLGELVAGKKPGRETPLECILICTLGLALGDMATAPLVYRHAVERGLGTWLPL